MMSEVLRVGIVDDVDDGPDERFAFGPEAAKWRAHTGGVLSYFDDEARPAARAHEVKGALAYFGGVGQRLEQVAFFCHGHARSLQTGHDASAPELSETAVSRLAHSLAQGLTATGIVTLYACSCASDRVTPREEFAYVLAYLIATLRPDWRGWIDAHESAGHTTKNPMVYRYTPWEGIKARGVVVSQGTLVLKEPIIAWYVNVDGKARRPKELRARFARWRALLRTDFRFEYPRLTIEQIRARVP